MARAVSAYWLITRKHPPSVGGMQQLSWHIVRQVRAGLPTVVVKWRRGNWGLPLFLPWAALRLALALLAGRVRAVHLGDPVLAALAVLARWRGVPVAVTVHGLDISYPNRLYQAYLDRFFWGRMQAYVCISSHVEAMVAARGVPRPLIHRVPVGAPEPPAPDPAALPAAAAGASPLLCSVGRLVERKGIAWFVDQVLPAWLPRHPEAAFVIGGEGPARERIEAAITRHALSHQVHLLGAIDERSKWALLAASDLVVMPNRPVPDDVEGFGLAVLEAGVAGSYVLAADLEGLRDAVLPGCNGEHVPSGDVAAWLARLDALCADRPALASRGASARGVVARAFGWDVIGQQYRRILEQLAHGTG